MGIEAGFMIKHVRPYGMDAYAMICDPTGRGSLRDYLGSAGVSAAEINQAFGIWAGLALLDAYRNTDSFILGARAISQARWLELYRTEKSTIMFLNATQVVELSQQSDANRGRPFRFYPTNSIAISVTIAQGTGASHVIWDAQGADVAANGNGFCVHFEDIVP